MRHSGRENNQLRDIAIEKDFIQNADSSVLISFGKTKVICTATVEESVPRFLKDTGRGWVTAEYSMLPASTNERIRREVSKGKQSGRTMEIQRLIGRSLRAAIDLDKLGERSILIDCDVIQADGGTRTTSITGGMFVLYDVVQKLISGGQIAQNPIQNFVSAISIGLVQGQTLLDLDYEEDSTADVDLNLVMTDDGRFIEIQGTAEQTPFSPEHLSSFLDIGTKGIQTIIDTVKQSLMVSFDLFFFIQFAYVINSITVKSAVVHDFFFDLIKEQVFIIRGECQHSGRCCSSIMVYDNAQPIQSMHNWRAFLRRFPEYDSFKPNHVAGHIASYDCDCLMLDNRCSRYFTRPAICRQYPTSFFYKHGFIHDTCGYYVDHDEKYKWVFPTIKRDLDLFIKRHIN